MAELKIKADSGGGTVALKGPATTTGDAAIQLTLPVDDGTAGTFLKTDGNGALSWASATPADNSITGAKIAMGSDAAGDVLYYNGTDYIRLAKGTNGQVLTLAGGVPTWSTQAAGITSAQNFRLAASQAGSNSTGTVLTNWEEVDTEYSALGSVWSQSSGVFSASTTGIYLCMFQEILTGSVSSGDAFDPNVQTSTDSGSNYTTRAHGWAYATNGQVDAAGNQFMFDVTNASTFRLRMRQSDTNNVASQSTIEGSTSENATHVMIVRLGDT